MKNLRFQHYVKTFQKFQKISNFVFLKFCTYRHERLRASKQFPSQIPARREQQQQQQQHQQQHHQQQHFRDKGKKIMEKKNER